MSIKTQLKRSLYQLLKNDNSGSYASKHDRKGILNHFVKDLVTLSYKLPAIQNIKSKHITAVVEHWKQQGRSSGTIKNRLSAIRHMAVLMNKADVVPSNQALLIAPRQYVTSKNRAINQADFSNIKSPEIKLSLELQRVFGLRREEALKIKPQLADKQDKLELQPSWCKGGRGRTIPIRTEEQRYWLDQAKMLTENTSGSLIPEGKSYIKQRYIYVKQLQRAGLSKLHGLRHAYAQRRYKELTGWDAPICGGIVVKQLTPAQKKIDRWARMVLTEELGHSRIGITVNYLGK